MKRLIASYILCLAGITFFGLALVPIVSANGQFVRIIEDGSVNWTISLNVLLWMPLLIYSAIITIVLFRRKRKEGLSFWLYPLILPAADEREKAISAAACRKAFTAIWIVAPVCAGLMCFYPLFTESFPYYPIMVILLIPMIQVSIYFAAVRKIDHG